jgi:alpha-L-rhamnosidase
MKAWVEYMARHAGDRYILDYGFHFGDWLSFAEYYSLVYNAPDYGFAGAHTDKDLIATAYYYYSTHLLMKSASVLGMDEDVARYSELLPRIKAAFQREFMTPGGRLASNTQTAYSMALQFDLLPQDLRQQAADRIADNVKEFRHLTTGFLGTPLLCHALSENGHPETAYYLLFQDKYPSWLFPVTMGATTIWERWDGIKPDSTFQNVGMNSFNHYAYGAIGEWIYQNVTGIKIDPENPGYKNVRIKPLPTDKLDYAKSWHTGPYGKIESGWKSAGDALEFHIIIPPNSTARICLPASGDSEVWESGKSVEKGNGISGIEQVDDCRIIEIGSGKYIFTIKL